VTKKNPPEVEFSAPLWLNKGHKTFLESRRIELLEKIKEQGSISKAAKAAGMSYKGAWDAINSMNNLVDRPLTVKLVGGRDGGGTHLTEEGQELIRMFRMVEAEHSRALQNLGKNVDDLERGYKRLRRISMRLSAKNVLFGVVRELKVKDLHAEVGLELKSGHRIVSTITANSVETLGLGGGDEAYAVIKASSVAIVSHEESRFLDSANKLQGRIVNMRSDTETGEIIVDIGGGDTLSATVTVARVQNLGLKKGDNAVAMIDAANVIIGIE
jgi:molybdate transport system regulatory protein